MKHPVVVVFDFNPSKHIFMIDVVSIAPTVLRTMQKCSSTAVLQCKYVHVGELQYFLQRGQYGQIRTGQVLLKILSQFKLYLSYVDTHQPKKETSFDFRA